MDNIEKLTKTFNGLYHQFTTQKAMSSQVNERIEAIPKEIAYQTTGTGSIPYLPLDILALIFIAHSYLDWKTPLTISLVCRGWKQILLLTPRAWAYIPIHTPGLPGKMLNVWLGRCGTVPLHVCIKDDPSTASLSTIAAYTGNIACLSIPPRFYSYLLDYEISNLVQLSVSDTKKGGRWWNRNYGVDLSKFPKLRSLHLTDNANDTFSIKSLQPGFAPLEELRIWSNDQDWLKVVECCSETLTSLSIWIDGVHMVNLSSTTIRLPRLRYLLLSLNDHPRENQRRFPITLEAPNLQCYEEHSDSPDYLTLHDVSSAITEIVLNSTKPRDLRPALNLRTLHLNMESPAGSQILRTLGYDDNVCPKLDHIELYHSGDWCFPAKSAIHCRSFVSGHLIQIVDSDIPFTALNCGYHYKALKCDEKRHCCEII